MSIVYQVRVEVPADLHEEWLHWMTTTHISDVVKAGGFDHGEILEEISLPSDNSGAQYTYYLRYTCASLDVLREYQNTHAPNLQQEHTERYGTQVTASRQVFKLIAD